MTQAYRSRRFESLCAALVSCTACATLVVFAVPAAGQSGSGTAGAVEYDGSLVTIRKMAVPTVQRGETTRLIDGGVFEADGYRSLVIHIAGEVKQDLRKGGNIGVVLVPDVDPFDRAFRELGLLPTAIEVSLSLRPGGGPYFMTEPKRADVGFPRYRVLFYNETDSTMTVSFFAYRGR